MGKETKNKWIELPIENILAPNDKGVILGQGWSPQCEKQPSQSENDWGVLKTTAIQSGYFLEGENKLLPKHLEPRIQHEVRKGDLLITCAGPRNRCGVACLVRKTRKKLLLSGKMYRFRIKAQIAIPEFVELFLLSQKAWKEIDKMKTGGSDSGLNLTHTRFKKLLVPIPPLPEQQAIVAKIEELLSELENGIQQLETAQQQLKVYRQSLLKWAFEGKLTNKKVNDGELPKGWKIKELKEITSVLGDGLHGTPKYSANGDYYFINGNNLNDGKIEIKGNTKRVSFEEYNKYKKPLNENTIFVSINGSLGYTAFYNNENVILGKSACYFNVLETINKFYIRYFLTSSRFTSYANKNATGSTIKNVGLKTMRELQIPIPPTPVEQQLIVDELESKLTICDKIEETISQSLLQAETLRQSILKKAFEGKLINYESSIKNYEQSIRDKKK